MTRHRMRESLKTTVVSMAVDSTDVQSFTISARSELQTTFKFANKRALHPFRGCLGNSQVSTLPSLWSYAKSTTQDRTIVQVPHPAMQIPFQAIRSSRIKALDPLSHLSQGNYAFFYTTKALAGLSVGIDPSRRLHALNSET